MNGAPAAVPGIMSDNPGGLRSWRAAETDPSLWHRITEADAYEVLCCLPPIYFPGGFACSEPWRSVGDEFTYLAVAKVGPYHYARELAPSQFEPEAAKLAAALCQVTG